MVLPYEHQIISNTAKIVSLHDRIHETWKYRDRSEKEWKIWEQACKEFHCQYNDLAFLGGINGVRSRLRSGDQEAITYALSFLEIRPYFFRSGYIYKDLVRVLRNCPLSSTQKEQYLAIRERYTQFLHTRKLSKTILYIVIVAISVPCLHC
ncbi:hypothetical protein Syn7502_00066 [Synechococcus sp. PCC 7502]|uniref:hypothetical protein n=1 Tax=Synechococcus sp. PCC 7502 TaxID=1173263 RepID=UPI00029FAB34|nr:hypothetical protein [Synechococcus sp. PCC 7502]AFY72240.1 hypothetical protein Syn7502_00066 [Synechococcus sp. PCC 7502]